jgi:hypothetical protein
LKGEHKTEGHLFSGDTSLPLWHGWHAFRRGLATNLHAAGVDDKTIQAILRHSNVRITQDVYIKTIEECTVNATTLIGEKMELVASMQRKDRKSLKLEARGGIEPPIKVLQTFALPLGDRAIQGAPSTSENANIQQRDKGAQPNDEFRLNSKRRDFFIIAFGRKSCSSR